MQFFLIKYAPKILFILVIIFIFFFLYNIKEDIHLLSNLKIKYIILTIFLALVFFTIESTLLKVVLNTYHKISYLTCFGLVIVSYFLNLILPFSGIGFRYYFLSNNYNINFKNFININLCIYIINFSMIILILNFFYLFQKDFLKNIYNINILILFISLFFFFLLNYFFFIKKNFFFFKKFFFFRISNKKIIKSYFFSFLMYSSYFLMIHYCILAIDDNFSRYDISVLLGFIAEILFIFKVTPGAIGTIEGFFYFILASLNYDNNSIIAILVQYRLSMFIIILSFGSYFFYKFFNLSISDFKKK